MLPEYNTITKNYITNTLIPALIKDKRNKMNLVNYDKNYVDFFENGVYVMLAQNDIFISPCNENGVLSKEAGKSRRYNNILTDRQYNMILNHSREIKTEEVMKNISSIEGL